MPVNESDFLVIGSGLAGLLTAHKLSALGEVNIITKKDSSQSSTNMAQGGIASVIDSSDSTEFHFQDTCSAGAGLCDPEIVRLTVQDAPERIRELVSLGVRFSRKDGKFDLALEGGHSRRRILHAEDLTGQELERALIQACRNNPRIHFRENHICVDLILKNHPKDSRPEQNRCLGAYVLEESTRVVESFLAGKTILATGGAGKVYRYTSNPDVSTGDGMATAFRAGVPLKNLEFVQFHPTCLYHPKAKSFLISEALRGEGGILRLSDGTAFMSRYSKDRELAPRDIVARAIDSELKKTGEDCVYLDMTSIKPDFLKSRFPNIYEKCLTFGIDMTTQPIPVVPAAHFFCGGVAVDSYSRTVLPELYAVGETACTGLHGANRLASNSLLEACVFAHRAFMDISRELAGPAPARPSAHAGWNPGKASQSDEAVVITQNWDEIRTLMWNYVGIVRSDKRLERAARRMKLISEEIKQYYWDFLLTRDLIELRNIACLAEQIIVSAKKRRESRGLHFNLNCPSASEEWRQRPTIVDRY